MEERIGSVCIQRFEGILQNKFFKATHVPFDFEVAATVLNLVSMLMNVEKIFSGFPQTSVWGDLLVSSSCVCTGRGSKDMLW